jgi:Uma2 family endonuclease
MTMPMTDEEFTALCDDHPDVFFEVTSDGDLIAKPPAYSFVGVRKTKIARHLCEWADRDGRGVACNSSGGFVLPNGARRSADASWTLYDRVDQWDGYWRLCPDFVIELHQPGAPEKMQEWLANGAQLAWLIDPETRSVSIYRPGAEVEIRTGIDSITGEPPVDGFVLDLRRVWNPRETS